MNTCAWINCTTRATSRGLCGRHYDATMRAGRRTMRAARPDPITRTPPAEVVYQLTELDHLLGGGAEPVTACARVGWTVEAALRSAEHRRAMFPDLAPALRRALRTTAEAT